MRGDYVGVINVVSYGYHEYEDAARAGQPIVRPDRTVEKAYLERHQQTEIEVLHEWIPLLGYPDTIKWLMTVVTKADLWWDMRDTVTAYYLSGPYYEALGPAQALAPTVLEYCSVFRMFYGRGKLVGLLDDEGRGRLRSNLLGTLLEAIGKGRSNG